MGLIPDKDRILLIGSELDFLDRRLSEDDFLSGDLGWGLRGGLGDDSGGGVGGRWLGDRVDDVPEEAAYGAGDRDVLGVLHGEW